ncbi:hypothetical protein GOA77_16305 [Sinorhizobium meliloti]|uniref:hypothetical protein n=1 Tax=Rhizobium meliloti TaxID=382 RepID=UPI00030B5C55|nr:hypothetical protein [Sinorhizobium meliloti]MDE4552984.1 hypothetical protein [Sinorhizobium meliloti]MDW9534028.1 hypothetical protein [Sinorhizobium meliloti]MDW9826772.1 hypothetical protein [Sinorhizobium meliloti]MDW9903410.1 hypothetical protein [Sinorhizobium meliloti]MQU81595.1 hypothetical protein [Sinorhizobium meliloti]
MTAMYAVAWLSGGSLDGKPGQQEYPAVRPVLPSALTRVSPAAKTKREDEPWTLTRAT